MHFFMEIKKIKTNYYDSNFEKLKKNKSKSHRSLMKKELLLINQFRF